MSEHYEWTEVHVSILRVDLHARNDLSPQRTCMHAVSALIHRIYMHAGPPTLLE